MTRPSHGDRLCSRDTPKSHQVYQPAWPSLARFPGDTFHSGHWVSSKWCVTVTTTPPRTVCECLSVLSYRKGGETCLEDIGLGPRVMKTPQYVQHLKWKFQPCRERKAVCSGFNMHALPLGCFRVKSVRTNLRSIKVRPQPRFRSPLKSLLAFLLADLSPASPYETQFCQNFDHKATGRVTQTRLRSPT